MTSSPRILVIGYCYPPTATPEAFVTAKLLRNIPDCEIDILTLEDGLVSSYSDPEMGEYAECINGQVIKVTPSWLTRKLCRTPRLPIRPDRWILANRSVRQKAIKIAPQNYDCIITRSQYHSAHLVGLYLKKKFPQLPWISCFSDPWSSSDHQKDVPIFSNYSAHQENKVLQASDHLVFPTEGLLDHMCQNRKNLIEKSSVVPHCFDPKLYSAESCVTFESCKNELVWRIFGSFYGNRKPDTLIQALDILKVPNGKKVRIEIFGTAHPRYENFNDFNRRHEDREIIYMGQIPHKRALRLMQTSDLLIVVDSTEQQESFYLPSKIIDYIGSGTTILSICGPGTVEEVTIKNGHLIANIENPSSISLEMENILRVPKPIQMKQAHSPEYNSDHVSKTFLKIINSTIKK
ncbi:MULTISPECIES: hypothetical protein [unclassified Thalassospira]|uniref:hypothetical protein n=1 Tax=unclassified Thalassospira TaxID=2648997 RepID=UPI001B0C8EF4|nr:hypothetical protein [Thalassospira sp.]MBO6770028.1 hypothetical protein [Thalassospira sp.]